MVAEKLDTAGTVAEAVEAAARTWSLAPIDAGGRIIDGRGRLPPAGACASAAGRLIFRCQTIAQAQTMLGAEASESCHPTCILA